jgi:hypothetical protein
MNQCNQNYEHGWNAGKTAVVGVFHEFCGASSDHRRRALIAQNQTKHWTYGQLRAALMPGSAAAFKTQVHHQAESRTIRAYTYLFSFQFIYFGWNAQTRRFREAFQFRRPIVEMNLMRADDAGRKDGAFCGRAFRMAFELALLAAPFPVPVRFCASTGVYDGFRDNRYPPHANSRRATGSFAYILQGGTSSVSSNP